jgi:hypothetical protein
VAGGTCGAGRATRHSLRGIIRQTREQEPRCVPGLARQKENDLLNLPFWFLLSLSDIAVFLTFFGPLLQTSMVSLGR